MYGFQKSSSPRQRVLAIVNGEAITLQEYFSTLENLKQRYGNLMALQEIDVKKLEKLTLDSLIEHCLLLQEAEKRDIRVKEEDIIKTIRSFPMFRNEKGEFDRGRFEQITAQYPLRTWQDSVEDQIKIDRLKRMITRNAKVSDEDVGSYYKQNFGEVKVKYLFIDPEEFKAEVELSDEEIKNFYEAQKQQFKEGPKVKIEYLLLKLNDIDDRIVDVSPSEMEDYYKEWTETDTQTLPFSEMKETIETTLKKKKKEKLAKEQAFRLSLKLLDQEDWKSFALKEGLLYQRTAFFSAEDEIEGIGYSPEVQREAFSLTLEEVSDPLKVEQGYIVFRIVDKKEPTVPPLKEISEKVAKKLREVKAWKIAQEKGKEVLSELKQGVSMEDLARKNSLPLNESQYFLKEGLIEEIGFCPEITRAAFSLQEGEYSEVISTSESMYIIQLLDKKDPLQEELPKYQSWIRGGLLGEKKTKIYEQWLKEIKKQAKIDPRHEPALSYY